MRVTQKEIKTILTGLADLLTFAAGASAAVVLSETDATSSVYFSGFLIYFSLIVASIFAVIVFVDGYAMFAIKTSTYHSFLMAVCILICAVLSPDYLRLLNLTEVYGALTNIIQYGVYGFFLFILVIFFNYSYDLKMPLKRRIVYIATCVVSFALYAGLYFVKWHFLAFVVALPMIAELTYYTAHNPNIKCFNSFSFRPTQFLAMTLSGLILVNVIYSSGFVDDYPFGTTSFYLFAMALTYGFIYVSFVRNTQKSELANARYRVRYEQVKSGSLQAQIKPHFVFNVLASIKSLYHVGTESGDYAMDLFSKHLRAQTEATGADMIPFEKELDNIRVFIDLENIRREKELNVIFDIEYSDFLIPALSLQPFIENAIKYSGISEKEDGYILISSRSEKGEVVLEISDNGVGFDTGAIPASSYGIRNSVERFRLLTGATPEIISAPGEGTGIRIRLDRTCREKTGEEE